MAEQIYTELKSFFSLTKSQKTLQFAYGCMIGLILFTIFLSFSPSSNNSTNSFSNLYSVSLFNSTKFDYKSHFNNIFSYFSPGLKNNTTTIDISKNPVEKNNTTIQKPINKQNNTTKFENNTQISQNSTTKIAPKLTENKNNTKKSAEVVSNNKNNTKKSAEIVSNNKNNTKKSAEIVSNNNNITKKGVEIVSNKNNNTKKGVEIVSNNKNNTKKGVEIVSNNKNISKKGVEIISNLTSSLKKQRTGTQTVKYENIRNKKQIVESLKKCDLYEGEWVRDETYPLYKPGSCLLIDEQFNCFLNGRPDNRYYQLKWKPKQCDIPRLNGTHMLEMLRGKRLVFVGDSLNRNMWESLICILRNSVKDQSKVYEASGRHHFRTEPSYSFVFQDYNCTIEFFVSPFLVQEWEMPDKSGSKKETLRLDLVGRAADQYKTADILIFNTGHWWTHDKTAKGKDYYQEGRHIYHELNVLEAFHKALTTWGRWVDASVDPKKTSVFFRGYSASHFRGGQWNSGGQCDHETEPIKNTTYLSGYPSKMNVLEEVLHNLKTHVSYLNITRLTDFRKDGHPSMYRKQVLSKEEKKSPLKFQDCSHWCLPGVPDAWNEILYAELLIKQSQSKQQ